MPSLAELKAKWFIDVTNAGPFPRQTRITGSQLQASTDGNLLTPIIDGEEIFKDFKNRVESMIASADPSQHELWIASWRLDPVKLLGEDNPGPTATELILQAASAGVKVRFLGSGDVLTDLGKGDDPIEFSNELRQRGSEGAEDERIPLFGSQHQKFNVFRKLPNEMVAVVGSADLSFTRWDTVDHAENDAGRPDSAGEDGGPTHDVAIRVEGPVVHDVALTFTERWNDVDSHDETQPHLTSTIPTDFLATPIPSPAGASHSVQVLRTYGIDDSGSYSFASEGEFTVWASYLNAIKQATTYIYVEDQYFYTFNDPPAVESGPGVLRNTDLAYQLGEALRRNVDVILVLAGRSEDLLRACQNHQRLEAISYLKDIADFQPAAVGRFVPCFLQVGAKRPVVHSKIMLVDDQFALIGSANFALRSMAHDSELQLGVVDENEAFVKNLRLALWQEHLELGAPDSLDDPRLGAIELENRAKSGLPAWGRLRIHPSADPGSSPCFHSALWDSVIDPYEGPDRED